MSSVHRGFACLVFGFFSEVKLVASQCFLMIDVILHSFSTDKLPHTSSNWIINRSVFRTLRILWPFLEHFSVYTYIKILIFYYVLFNSTNMIETLCHVRFAYVSAIYSNSKVFIEFIQILNVIHTYLVFVRVHISRFVLLNLVPICQCLTWMTIANSFVSRK